MAARWLPHPPNFSPVAALALFGGASFSSKRAAFLVPVAAMFLSDIVLGFYTITPVIYGSFALITCLGFWLRQRPSLGRLAGASIIGALIFSVVTNFAVWALGTMYPKNWAGLADCFIAAIPFFRNTLTSDLFYSALLFGSLMLVEKRWPKLAETAPVAA